MRLSPSLLSTALLSIALLCASGQALASNTHPLPTADESAACPETPGTAAAIPGDETEGDAALTAPAHRTPQKAKPATTVRGGTGGGNRGTAPRWHSFLPGMFR